MSARRRRPWRSTDPTASPAVASARSWRRALVRGACAGVVATVTVTAVGGVASAAPTPLVSSGFAGLRQGAQGGDVATLQRSLIAAGIPVAGGADGVYGPATRRAVSAFQSTRGLPTTGEVDEATAQALASSGSGGSSGTAYVGLRQGASGQAVKDIQRSLVKFGVYLADGADGDFGPGTARGVRQFQAWNGLSVTGVVDAATAKRLGLTGAGAAPSGSSSASSSGSTASAGAASASSGGYGGLAAGARGPKVKEMQQALLATGLTVRGGADGVFGPATAAALRAFQRVNGIAQTGTLTERGAQILGLGSAAGPVTSSGSNRWVGLQVGSTGQAVKELQQALITAGVSVRGGADGAFGSLTKAALASYQRSVGLGASGAVDRATADKLGLGASGRPAPFASGGSSGTTTATPTATNGYAGLSVGARGPKVTELQNALQRTGLVLRGGADGVFGGATRSALVFFQKVNGMAQTGVLTQQQADLMGLGTGAVPQTAVQTPTAGGPVTLERFPVQGQCFFGDTWHAARGGGRKHEGTDFIAAQGKFLYAVVDGTVSKLYWDQPGRLSGNGLRIEKADGTYYTYLHLYSFAPGIAVGTKVKAGDVIGFVGTTGSSATPHLHFEIHPGGGPAVNPYPYVKAIDDCDNTAKRYQSSFS